MTEHTVTLADERDRLDDLLDDVVEMLAEADPETQSAQQLRDRANRLDQQGRGVAHLIDEFDADATVTVRELMAGDFARVEDRVNDIRERRDGPSASGAHRNVFTAMGLVDAPFLPEDTDYETRLSAVADQPIGVVQWLYALVDQETTVDEGNWTPLRERLRDTRLTSTSTNSSDTQSES